jgi:hypothetical protein
VTAAQVALAVLIGVLIAAAVVLIALGKSLSGWVFGGVGILGFLALLSMILTNDRRTEP